MGSQKKEEKSNYTILGIGDSGQYVLEKLAASNESGTFLHLHICKELSDFKPENVKFDSDTKALFLIFSPVEEEYFEFILKIESIRNATGLQIYVITNYPFLWEGNRRISMADACLLELLRFSFTVIRIESHQWFPLKDEHGFHKVVEMVFDVAKEGVRSFIELHSANGDIKDAGSIAIGDNAHAIKRSDAYWTVERI